MNTYTYTFRAYAKTGYDHYKDYQVSMSFNREALEQWIATLKKLSVDLSGLGIEGFSMDEAKVPLSFQMWEDTGFFDQPLDCDELSMVDEGLLEAEDAVALGLAADEDSSVPWSSMRLTENLTDASFLKHLNLPEATEDKMTSVYVYLDERGGISFECRLWSKYDDTRGNSDAITMEELEGFLVEIRQYEAQSLEDRRQEMEDVLLSRGRQLTHD